jgi:hypothetical protein
MLLPFSAPRLPELDAMPVDKRRLILARYASSPEAHRFIRVFQISILAAAVLLGVAFSFAGAVRLACI